MGARAKTALGFGSHQLGYEDDANWVGSKIGGDIEDQDTRR